MRIRIAVPEKHVNASILDAALEATTRANEAALKAGDAKPISPFIKAGRVRWKPEPFTDGEHFDLSRQVVERGWGDCDDLAPAYAAELRYTGRDPGARAVVRRSGPNLWHAVTLLSDGTVKDPSRSAGMGKRGGVHGTSVLASIAEGPVVGVRPYRDGWAARCDLPIQGTDIAISSLSLNPSPQRALEDAIEGACFLAGDDTGLGDLDDVARAAAISGAVCGADFNDLLQGVDGYIGEDELAGIYEDVQGAFARCVPGCVPGGRFPSREAQRALAASAPMPARPGSVADLVAKLTKISMRGGLGPKEAALYARKAARGALTKHGVHGYTDAESVGSLFGSILKSAVSILPIPGAGLVSNLLPDIDPFKSKGGGGGGATAAAPGGGGGGGGGGPAHRGSVQVTHMPNGAITVQF
jgi:hypothetical protein